MTKKEILMNLTKRLTNDMLEEIHEHVSTGVYGTPYNTPLPNFNDFTEEQSEVALDFILDADTIQGEEIEDLKEFIRSNEEDNIPEELKKKRSPLSGLSPLLMVTYLMSMSPLGRLNGFLDTGDYKFIGGGGNSTKDSFGGRTGHTAKGYIQDKKGFKKIETLDRNDPCSCGSGKKFKKCCMNK